MLLPRKDLNQQKLLTLVEDRFGVTRQRLEFAAVGEDSWCYRFGKLWISVRRDLRGHTPAAYEAAELLQRSGLDFVLAPLRAKDGRVVHQVDGLPVIVFPYLESTSLDTSPPSPQEVHSIVDMLSRVHNSKISVDLPTENFTLSFDADLERAMAAVDRRPPETGPYAERVHHLLHAHKKSIMAIREEYRELALACFADARPFVLTHGEPLPSNILRHNGRLLLADWGDAMWGPPERDWSHIVRTLGTAPLCRLRFRRLYDIRWVLSEIAEYSTILLDEHDGNSDDAAMWQRLLRYLSEES